MGGPAERVGRVAQTTQELRAEPLAEPAAVAVGPRSRAGLIRTLVEGAYVVLFAILLVRLVVMLRTPVPEPVTQAPASGGLNVPLGILSQVDPFGGEAPEEADPAAYADAAETTLDLTLFGLNIGPDLITATIQTPDGRQNPYMVGQEILPGVVLRDARPNQAILSRGGLTETLTLREDRPGGRPASRPTGANLPAAAAMLTPAETLAAASAALDLRRDENGAMALYPGAARQAFRDAGFAPGDVVVAVGGVAAPDDPERVLELIADMPPGRPVVITVERDGIPLDVPVDLQALNR